MPGTVSSAYFLSQQPWQVGPIAAEFAESGRDWFVVGHVVRSRGCLLQSQRPAVAVTLSSQNGLLLVLFAEHKGGNVLGGAQHIPPYRGWRESQMSCEFWVFVCLFPRWIVMAFTTSHGCPCTCAPSPLPHPLFKYDPNN